MLINDNQIKELQALLLELTGKEYSTQDAQIAGLAIVRFVSVKELYKYQPIQKENKDEDK